MTIKENQTGEPEFTIDGDDDTAANMCAMPVTDPAMAPTMDQIQEDTTSMNTPATTYPSIADPSDTRSGDRTMFGPSGRWKKGVFACFGTFFAALFWMGFCCTPCLYGQLMQRFNLTWTGQSPSPGQRATGTCMFVLVFTSIVYFFFIIAGGWVITVLWYLFMFYFFFMGILLRSVIRKKFGIAATTLPACDGVLEDFFLAFFCSCCSGIQMARHTHDEHRYPYNGCGTNGLPSYAPDLWDNLLEEDPAFNPYSTTSVMSQTNDASPSSPTSNVEMSNVEIV